MNKLEQKKYLPFILLGVGAILLLAGVWLVFFSNTVTTTDQTARTPLAGTTAEKGKEVFQQNCNVCHPGDGTRAGNGPKLSGTRATTNYDFLYKQVRNGRGLMPAFNAESVSEADISAVYQYLNSLK